MDDHGAGVADVRVHCARNAERETYERHQPAAGARRARRDTRGRVRLHVDGEEASAAAAQSIEARAQAAAQQQPYRAALLHGDGYATIVALSDLIIPRDGSSGSASDAGAPEFIDYIVAEQPDRQTAMRGGLVWLDSECRRRFDKTFVACTDAERRQVLDDIAWPAQRAP